MENNPVQNIVSYVLAKAANEDLPVREQLYSDLSKVVNDEEESKELKRMSHLCHDIVKSSEQAQLRFQLS